MLEDVRVVCIWACRYSAFRHKFKCPVSGLQMAQKPFSPVAFVIALCKACTVFSQFFSECSWRVHAETRVSSTAAGDTLTNTTAPTTAPASRQLQETTARRPTEENWATAGGEAALWRSSNLHLSLLMIIESKECSTKEIFWATLPILGSMLIGQC